MALSAYLRDKLLDHFLKGTAYTAPVNIQWHGPYDIVFADPPYAEASELPSLLDEPRTDDLFALGAWLIIEHAAKTALPVTLGCTQFLRRYCYGDTVLSLYFRPHIVPA